MKKIIKFFTILLIIILVSTPVLPSCKSYQPKISYVGYGGQGTISGSMHCLKIDKNIYMIDSGIFYGDEGDNYKLPADINLKNLRAVFITHAHEDHIGRLPLLIENGYSGPIYMTGVTYDLLKIMLQSSLKYLKFNISEEDLLKKLKQQVKIVSYNTPFYVGGKIAGFFNKFNIFNKLYPYIVKNRIKVEFLYTSHIPGSAMIIFNVNGKDILFSGDIGSDNNPFLMKNKQFEGNIDYLFVEGTYGTKGDNSNNLLERENFQKIIGKNLEKGFRVIIPAFVLDRTQQVLYEIKQGMDNNFIPDNTTVKVYSPTSFKITEKYRHYLFHDEAYKYFFSEKIINDFFDIQNLLYNPKNDEGSYDLNIEYGEIAVMSSGMMSHAFSKELIDKYIEDPKTFIVIVGYQAEGTLGADILEALENRCEYVFVDCKKKILNPDNFYRSYAFNSHADINQIINIFKNTSPNKIFLVHLNKEEAQNLKNKYKEFFINSDIVVPEYGKKYVLE